MLQNNLNNNSNTTNLLLNFLTGKLPQLLKEENIEVSISNNHLLTSHLEISINYILNRFTGEILVKFDNSINLMDIWEFIPAIQKSVIIEMEGGEF